MRILTVRQPWAWAIIHGGKDVENRARNLAGDYRGPVAIHAGLAPDDSIDDMDHPMHGLVFAGCPERSSFDHNRFSCAWCVVVEPGRWRNRGAIIGVVDIVDAHRALGANPGEANRCAPFGLCSPWAERDVWHLCLANPRPLAELIPYKGALGLRHLDGDTVAKVLRQIERAAS